MSTLSTEPKIISMAHSLGIHEGDSVEGIKGFCRRKIRTLVSGLKKVASIEELERIVCEKLNITIIEIWSDDDLSAVIDKYARQEKEPAFGALKKDLDNETFATLLQRKLRAGEKSFRYVAVIDCRGQKAARRFFTRWHEIAHVLTTNRQLEFPFHRSTVKKDPIERMMDIIAGDIGFFEPLFEPIVRRECTKEGGLTFEVVTRVRSNFCPTASLESTLNACAGHAGVGVIVVQAGLGYKSGEEREMASGQLGFFPEEAPTPQLRVLSAVPNEIARAAKIVIPKRMRVPQASIITAIFNDEDELRSTVCLENLNWWRSSDGKALRHYPVRVEATKMHDRVWAIVSLKKSTVFKKAA